MDGEGTTRPVPVIWGVYSGPGAVRYSGEELTGPAEEPDTACEARGEAVVRAALPVAPAWGTPNGAWVLGSSALVSLGEEPASELYGEADPPSTLESEADW